MQSVDVTHALSFTGRMILFRLLRPQPQDLNVPIKVEAIIDYHGAVAPPLGRHCWSISLQNVAAVVGLSDLCMRIDAGVDRGPAYIAVVVPGVGAAARYSGRRNRQHGSACQPPDSCTHLGLFYLLSRFRHLRRGAPQISRRSMSAIGWFGGAPLPVVLRLDSGTGEAFVLISVFLP